MTITLYLIIVAAGFCPHVVESAWAQLPEADRARWALRSRTVGRDQALRSPMLRGGLA